MPRVAHRPGLGSVGAPLLAATVHRDHCGEVDLEQRLLILGRLRSKVRAEKGAREPYVCSLGLFDSGLCKDDDEL